jgi:hypothetical protein
MSKKVAILQSNYIPWKGYFDLIHSVDEFVLYDDMQYTKNDWRNRNMIKSSQGPLWVTIPVRQLSLHQRINETTTANSFWRKKHWTTIQSNYAKAPFFKRYEEHFKELYLGSNEELLSHINYAFIQTICSILGITTPIRWSHEFELTQGKSERLVDLCQQLHATDYISGPAARDYLDEKMFATAGIQVTYFDYSGYKEYEQFYPPFTHYVSMIDLIFHQGDQAPMFMKTWTN